MGQFEITLVVVLVPSNSTTVVDWGSNGIHFAIDTTVRSVALTLNVLWTQALVATLSAASSTNSVTSIALHANFTLKHTSLSLRKSCHGLATNFLYLIATTGIETTGWHDSNT